MKRPKHILVIETSHCIPAMFDEKLLLDNGFIASSNLIDKSQYQISSFGSHIRINDDESTTINVSITQITIYSESISKVVDFFNIVKKGFPNTVIEKINYRSAIHRSEKDIFKTTANKLIKSSIMDLEEIKFKKDDLSIEIYECAKDRLHVDHRNTIAFDTKVQISELDDFDIDTFIQKSIDNANNFIIKELGL